MDSSPFIHSMPCDVRMRCYSSEFFNVPKIIIIGIERIELQHGLNNEYSPVVLIGH